MTASARIDWALQQEGAMTDNASTTTGINPTHTKRLALWLAAGLVGASVLTMQPAKAEYYGHHRSDRHHANPYRDNDGGGYHHRWRHHHRYEQRCTTRAVPYWDSYWGQWRTNYVRSCW
jgi:hypothetical protein